MVTKRRKKDGRASNGRKPTGLTEQAKLVEAPALLWAAVGEMARREGVSVAEWVRRAMRLRLGWSETGLASGHLVEVVDRGTPFEFARCRRCDWSGNKTDAVVTECGQR